MDKKLIETKHFTLYISTLQIAFGISWVTEYKELVINLGIFELNILFDTKCDAEYTDEVKIEDMRLVDRLLSCELLNADDVYYLSLKYTKKGDMENRYRRSIKITLDPKYRITNYYLHNSDAGDLYVKYKYMEKSH